MTEDHVLPSGSLGCPAESQIQSAGNEQSKRHITLGPPRSIYECSAGITAIRYAVWLEGRLSCLTLLEEKSGNVRPA